jgi:hypothetical protein
MSESHWWYLFHKEVKSRDFTTWFRFCDFKPQLESSIFKSIFWLNGSILGGDDHGFLKREARHI